MNKITYILSAATIACSTCVHAQNYEYNPFESLGKKAEVLTLSQGKYKEVYDNDTIMRIGSVLFNRVSNQVVAFVDFDTLYDEATLSPEVVSRFLSIDPLAREFPWVTPYNYAENSPIAFIDIYGLQKFLAITLGSDVRYRGANLVLKVPDAEHTNISANSSAKEGIIQRFKDATASDPKGIGFVAVFSHGVPDKLFGQSGYSNGITTENLSELEAAVQSGDITFAQGAIIYLGGCNAGTCGSFVDAGGNIIPFGQRLAEITGATVIAAQDQVGPLDETGGNLKFTTYSPKKTQFQAFEQGQEPQGVGSTVDVVELAKRARDRTIKIEKIKPLEIKQIPVDTPEPQLLLPGGN